MNEKWFLEFTLDMNPPSTTAQQKGVRVAGGRPLFYTKNKVTEAKVAYMMALKPYVPDEPMKGALGVMFHFKKHSKHQKEGAYKTTRPDLGNIEKLLEDTMAEMGFYKDDAQIVDRRGIKTWTRGPGCIEISLRELEDQS